jgi:hypothetical protein
MVTRKNVSFSSEIHPMIMKMMDVARNVSSPLRIGFGYEIQKTSKSQG